MNSSTFYQSKDGALVNLEDALKNENSTGRPIKIFVGNNTGNRTFQVLLTLFELQEFTEVANQQSNSPWVAQRKLDLNHATGIAKYILKGLISAVERKYQMQGKEIPNRLNALIEIMGKQPYLSIPPMVASFRDCSPNGTNLSVKTMQMADGETACFKMFLNHGDVFWVIDGQHRRKGVQLVFEFLDYVITHRKYPTKGSLLNVKDKEEIGEEELKIWSDCLERSKACTVSVEVHLGLNGEQEKQLFHDLNNLQRKVEASLALQFDQSNPINQFIKEVLMDEVFHDEDFNVHEKDKINWLESINGLTRKDLVAVNALLFLNKTNINNATPPLVQQRATVAESFWKNILAINNIKDGNARQLTVAAQPVVLKSLAKLTFDFFFGKNTEWCTIENQAKLIQGFKEIDFSHSNPIWRYYSFTPSQIIENNLESLIDYLPEAEGNRDLGNFTNGEFRFGSKHNDIYPIIGDMIRWMLKLPKRKKESVQATINL